MSEKEALLSLFIKAFPPIKIPVFTTVDILGLSYQHQNLKGLAELFKTTGATSLSELAQISVKKQTTLETFYDMMDAPYAIDLKYSGYYQLKEMIKSRNLTTLQQSLVLKFTNQRSMSEFYSTVSSFVWQYTFSNLKVLDHYALNSSSRIFNVTAATSSLTAEQISQLALQTNSTNSTMMLNYLISIDTEHAARLIQKAIGLEAIQTVVKGFTSTQL